ncbi:kelch-like protein 26 [Gastrophryne carolinensis]
MFLVWTDKYVPVLSAIHRLGINNCRQQFCYKEFACKNIKKVPFLAFRMVDSSMKCNFSAPGHSTTLLHGLSALRTQGQLLDVMLTVHNEVFQVHKVVLAACSDYFR